MPARIVIREKGRNLTSADRTAINNAFLDALRMARRVENEINSVWNQPGRVRQRRSRRRNAWSAHANFTRWFGTSRRHILLRRVRRRIIKLRKWLDRGRIVVLAHDGGDRGCSVAGRNAYAVIPRRPLKVHLCPPWFTRGESRRAAILIHELVHELGFAHPEGTTTPGEALALARSDSKKARRSPENYENLYELYF
ncbi:M35 family metallo-endopeptidase [Kangiella marina]|uniref:Lysine-specific metallo-endopeptidase domain-containing protein n=1 Tax=Kangiella marina TaxID=1079178 RepID=A0ABP8IDR2_9GAMM